MDAAIAAVFIRTGHLHSLIRSKLAPKAFLDRRHVFVLLLTAFARVYLSTGFTGSVENGKDSDWPAVNLRERNSAQSPFNYFF